MHLVSCFKLIQENDTAAPVDRHALRAGNYVAVTEISGFLKGAPINVFCAPCPSCQKFGALAAPAN